MATAPVPTTPTLSHGSIEPLYSSTPSTEGPSTSFHNEASDFELEKSREDMLEHESVETFMSSTCGCRLGPKSSPCCILLTRDAIERYRAESLELSRDELDLVILAQLRACRTVQDQPSLRSTHHEITTDRCMTKYYAHGLQICRKTFMFLHHVSRKRLENIIRHYEETGLCTRVHGNTKRLPTNALSLEESVHVTTFITNYARAHAMPLPGRLPSHKDKVMILPSDITKIFVYSKYKQACESSNRSVVGRSKFYDIWQHQLPHISICTPSTDLCFTCQQNSLSIQKSFCLSEDEKATRLATAQEHLLRAKTERNHYNSQVDTAQKAWTLSKVTGQSPRIAHYSYDFAQQIHYPYDSQQTGPEYFKTARKCGLFGVCNDGNNKQVLYLIDEVENPGKGADCVISLVHHYLENYAEGEKCVYLHADNCVGQNKNNATIQYLLWRVLTGRQESIELSFMLVGHTKFSPDRHFGTFKKAFRVSSVSTLAEIATVVERTSTNTPQLIRDVSGTVLVPFYRWSAYLGKFFRTIASITSYHCFRTSSDKPGKICAHTFSDTEAVEIDLLKPDVSTSDLQTSMPEKTTIPGLDLTRQWYLYENIRMHCKSTLAADITCPLPSAPKPSSSKSSASSMHPSVPSSSRQSSTPVSTASESNSVTPKRNASNNGTESLTRKRKHSCTLCKKPGHTKRTCPDKQ